ncbi:EamA family transporter [Flavobacteriales bacterium]|nr:EamA family transporter [Flavobacteriales bacterium]
MHAITINYFVASTCGFIYSDSSFDISEILSSAWIFHALIIGSIFMLVFYLLAIGTQKVGITISTVANKMSLIIPVAVSIIWYDSDQFSWIKLVGIFIALTSVYLTTTNEGKLAFDKKYIWLIIIIFLFQGIADTVFSHAQKTAVEEEEMGLFFSILFFVAGITGLIASLPKITSGTQPIKGKALFFGLLIGIPNFLTLKFFFDALNTPSIEPSIAYPLVSMGIILASSITGLLLFKERLSWLNWAGIGLSFLAIVTLTYAG